MTPIQLKALLLKRLPKTETVSTAQLRTALRACYPEVTDATLAWRLSLLKKENLIQQVARGQYSFKIKSEYVPAISLKTKRAVGRIKSFGSTTPIVWDTQMLNAIANETKSLHWIFVEVDRDELELIFENSVQFSKKLFANPDRETVTRYLLPVEDAIILIPKVSETPVLSANDFNTLAIEGLLVNIFWHYDKFFKPCGYDIEKIFKKAFDLYTINTVKLLRFAARRDKRTELENLISNL
jgi:hypothetical protein